MFFHICNNYVPRKINISGITRENFVESCHFFKYGGDSEQGIFENFLYIVQNYKIKNCPSFNFLSNFSAIIGNFSSLILLIIFFLLEN